MEPQHYSRLVFCHNKVLKDDVGFSSDNISFTNFNLGGGGGWFVKIHDDSRVKPNGVKDFKFGDCILWNSITSEVIKLPSLLNWITSKSSHQYNLYLSVSSSSPQLGHNGSSTPMVFFLFSSTTKTDSYLLLFCRPRDSRWKRQKLSLPKCSIETLICINDNNLYILWNKDYHMEIEIFDETITMRTFKIKLDQYSSVGGMCSLNKSYYVKVGDEIYKVIRCSYPGYVHDKVFEIHVYKMDMSSMVWEEIRSLGDRVFFLDDERLKTAMYYSAADLGLTRGYLYFTMPNDKNLYKFDLEYNTITISLPSLSRSTLSPTDWFATPTALRGTDSRRTRRKVVLDKTEEEKFIVLAPERKISIQDCKDQEGDAITLGILSKDILILLASYLHPIDYIHFRSICKSNRSTIPAMKWRSSFQFNMEPKSFSPWLTYNRKDDAVYTFVDPMHNNDEYFMSLSEMLLGATIRASKGGWLLMSKGLVTLFFYNPFTRKKIEFPDCPVTVSELSTMSFSSLPTSSNCEVFAITDPYYMSVKICYNKRRHKRRNWLCHDFPCYCLKLGEEEDINFMPSLSSPIFYCSAFYCLDVKGTLGVFSVKGFSVDWTILAKPGRPCDSFNQCYLVKCEKNLLALFMGNLGQNLGIYRLDLSEKKWVKVESLGKHMLFVSNTSCISALARDSRMENKVYFSRFHNGQIIYYSLDTGKYHSVGSQYSADNFYNTNEQLTCNWIEPIWSYDNMGE